MNAFSTKRSLITLLSFFTNIISYRSEVAQLCPTLCDPMDCRLQGSSVHGIFQARVLQWVAISFSRRSSWPRDRTQVSRIAGRRFNPLSHQGNPRIPEWVAYPFFRGSSWPTNQAWVSCIAGEFFTTEPPRKLTILEFNKGDGDGIPVELFQILKDDAVRVLHSVCQQKLSSGHRTGKGQFSFQSQRKAMLKNVQTMAQLYSSHMLVK